MNVDDYLRRFRERVLQDALSEATADYWLRRAEQFETARSRPGDHTPDPEAQAQRDTALAALAEECRQRAATREQLGTDWWEPILKEVLGEEQGP